MQAKAGMYAAEATRSRPALWHPVVDSRRRQTLTCLCILEEWRVTPHKRQPTVTYIPCERVPLFPCSHTQGEARACAMRQRRTSERRCPGPDMGQSEDEARKSDITYFK